MLLRSGPNGVQKITPTGLKRPPSAVAGAGTERAAPKIVAPATKSAPSQSGAVLSSRLDPPSAKRPPARATNLDSEEKPLLLPRAKGAPAAAAARKGAAPPSQPPPQQRAQAPHTPGTRPAPPSRPPPGAKPPAAKPLGAKPPASKPPSAKPPATKPAVRKPKSAAEDKILETDDWAREFERKWAAAMGGDTAATDEASAEPAEDEAWPEQEEGEEEAEDQDDRVDQEEEDPEAAEEEAAFEDAPAPPPVRQAKVAGSYKRPAPQPAAAASKRSRTLAADTGDTPMTPGGLERPANPAEEKIRNEHPEWAARCTLEPAKPGQPIRLTVSMAEAGLGDAELSTWCSWMDRRMAAECPSGPSQSSARTRFKAGTIDFSENKFGITGVKALCAMLEKHVVRCEVLRLTANNMGNEAARCVAKYLTSFSQTPAQEVHLTRNKISAEGVRWLIGCLAMHPAFPIWSNDSQRYVPLKMNVDNNKVGLKGEVGHQLLAAACATFACSVCVGEKYSEETKHNGVVHLCNWDNEEGAVQLPIPSVHARPMFAPAGRGAAKAPPSGAQDALREEPRIVYEDEDCAVVMKPPGWSCLPQPKGVNPSWSKLKPLARRQQVAELLLQTASPPLQAWLLLHFGADPNCDASRDQASDRGLAHRLDVETSGPILVGKTQKGYEHAKKQIVVGLLKDYVCLVHGTFSTERGECRAPIDTSTYADTKRVRIAPEGQPATTIWEALAEYESPDLGEKYTLVHCRMVTLRTHQTRVHMQYLGHPLVGDKLYGSGDKPAFCPRIFLHKFRIGFFNTKNVACIEACSLQTAPDLWKALGKLKKVGGMAMMGCGAPGL